MKKLVLIFFALVLSTSNSYASDSDVDEMFDVMHMEAQMNGGFEAMLPVIDEMAAQFNLDDAAKQELRGIYRVWFDKDMDRAMMMREMKELYAAEFSKEEIEAITQFYQTEVGQKFMKKGPQLMQLGAQIGIAEAKRKEPKLLERLKPFFDKHNIK
ncbi:hypothetical protein GCM10011297_26650 [Bacterioplanes sanyensis]|uniref:DUF2059 domain-containing protein n=1 Tax=Bacterioplanes sanyensis TaxID=1249553 RepID=UPI00167B4BF9|nr:DUF2059 domain-containing protein [Bacterioplanes sanyensis]GGY52414.1 hypothetical protein GCM10011297_26650 [Bacterioplanes sanyensis]